MANTIRTGKQNRHEKITVALLSGKPVTPDEIRSVFKGTDQEAVMYRLSTNIYNIRKDGGIVKVIKDGRKVQAYQLVNHTEFDKNGRYIQPTALPVARKASPSASNKQTSDNSLNTENTETAEA
jgi:hypothetical protein